MGESASSVPGCWLGRTYFEALAQARGLGLAPRHVVITRPPRAGIAEGELRVIAIRPWHEADGFSVNGDCAEESAASGTEPQVWEWIAAYPKFEHFAREGLKTR